MGVPALPHRMKVLVTGATGFLGRNLIPALLRNGHRVRALVRSPARIPSEYRSQIETAIGDITMPDSLQRPAQGVDAVIHSAALMSDREWEPWSEFVRVNVEGTRALMDACANASPQPLFVHVSSSSVTGPARGQPIREDSPLNPEPSPYARSKAEAEKVVTARRDLPWVIARLPALYGPGASYGWPDVLRKVRAGKFAVIGEGNGRMQLTHVSDAVQGLLRILENGARISPNVYQLAGPESIRIADAFDLLAAELGVPPPRRVSRGLALAAAHALSLIPARLRPESLRLVTPHRVRYFDQDYVYDTSRARAELGFEPKIAPATGLRQLAAEFLAASSPGTRPSL
jgi:nucleoside-diphosphate-sugar epimerase